jgi:hypothetical protein
MVRGEYRNRATLAFRVRADLPHTDEFLRQQSFSMLLALAGIGIWVGFVAFAVVLAGGRR